MQEGRTIGKGSWAAEGLRESRRKARGDPGIVIGMMVSLAG